MSKEKLIIILLIIVFSGGIIFIGTKVVVGLIAKNRLSSTADTTALQEQYSQKIAKEKNVNLLMDLGYKLLNGNQIDSAIINFQRVTQLEKNDRDGWLYLGIAQLKNKQASEALANFQTAEKLDPINSQTYEFLNIAYEQTGDEEAASKAREKYNYLTKNK